MRLSLLIPFLLLCCILQAQRFSKVKIHLDEAHTLHHLAQLGLDVEHGHFQPGKYFTGEFSETELAQVQAAGFSTQVLIEDLTAHLSEMNKRGVSALQRSLPPCPAGVSTEVQTPDNYSDGSMGGYHTYQEMLDILDTMAAKFPQLFKQRQPMSDSLTTIEGRPIYWVKISDNPTQDEAGEPEIFFNALTHAREPNGMSQLLFFMWHLLENYETDPEIKFLVDHSEIYFAPCLNPDGYLYNETTNPDGGGFWRKNRRQNADGSFGVDLNRNYGYQWGFDNGGSSPNPNSQTYRGTAPFSEPETRMVRDFCNEHEFAMAFNFHTFGNLLLHPWDYDLLQTPDHPVFDAFGELMTHENGYVHGNSGAILYPVNGGVNDWMYGDTNLKPKILAYAPEVGPGDTGFWPPQSDIDKLNKDAFYININALRLLHNHGLATPAAALFIQHLQDELFFSLRKMGLAPGPLTVSLTPLTSNVFSVSQPKVFNLSNLEEVADAFDFTLDPGIQNGDTVIFELAVDNGIYAWRQKVLRVYSTQVNELVFDPADDLSHWLPVTDWSVTFEDYVSAPSSITDSENAFYPPQFVNEIELAEPLTVKNAEAVYLNFWAKWDIEEDEDFVQVLASIDGSNLFPLCGTFTEPGTSEQVFEEPLYDGNQTSWVFESMDLSEYLLVEDSFDLKIIFRLVADDFIEGDGFYFDDLSLTVVEKGGISSTTNFRQENFSVSSRPNPAFDQVVFDLEGDFSTFQKVEIQVVNSFGQAIHQQTVRGKTARLDVSDWEPGVYFYRASVEGKSLPAGRFVVK